MRCRVAGRHVTTRLVPQAVTNDSIQSSFLFFHPCLFLSVFLTVDANPRQAAKEARVSARAVPSVTVRSYVTTSRVSPSPRFAVSPAVVVSSVSLP